MEYDEDDVKNRMNQLSNDDILVLSTFIMTGNYTKPNPLHGTARCSSMQAEMNKRSKMRKKYLAAIAGK